MVSEKSVTVAGSTGLSKEFATRKNLANTNTMTNLLTPAAHVACRVIIIPSSDSGGDYELVCLSNGKYTASYTSAIGC